MSKIEDVILVLRELEKLKYVERGSNVNGRKESTAEHSWSCIMIADILIDFADEPLDRLKVIEYLIYHDVVEVYAGDAKFNDPQQIELKNQKEQLAFDKIRSFMPNAKRFEQIFQGYEERSNREAEFAKAIDCLDACIRNLNDDAKDSSDGFTEVLIRQKYLPHVSKFQVTHEIFENIMEQLIASKRL